MPLKNDTAWSPVTPPGPTLFTVEGKSPAIMVSDNAKTPTLLTPTTKEQTEWSATQPQTGYHYDSSVTYDSNYGYDYINPVANWLNQKVPTDWGESNV